MRLWFAGWEPEDFKSEPEQFLEMEQRRGLSVYESFFSAMERVLKPGGILVMHVGETAKVNMAAELRPLLEPGYEFSFMGRESVTDTESHGLTDKGATVAHWYLFARRRELDLNGRCARPSAD